MKPRRTGKSAEVARALASVHRERREQRARERVVRRARGLGWLDASAFGYRMPSAAVLLRDAEWVRETPDHACWRCGVTRVPFEDVAAGCAECRDRVMACGGVPIHGVVRLGRYAPPLSQWVPAIKQRAWRDMGVTLGRELGLQVLDAVATGRIPKPDEVVPVPVHWLRRMLRGIDHARTIADEAATVLGVPCRPALRVPLARRQTGGSRDGRLDNRRRFAPGGGMLRVARGVVLLVDDVRTTGGTMRDAASALIGQGAAGFVMAACAVADPPSRASLRQNVDKF
jgi:predicted amidophosphoribosyltransferase